ncbi:hypothetical protein JQX13_22485 [Archangium violaceum]|uniref:hypothetical protein n=1 Tax=Archangium violaceum TaxID=83451 RepID=UPI00193BC5C5|nr:hypothetical protein [Archangium violaceum]QRK12548.1 hypothetical protein JQX13_22485 [Archangium violaceum]
MGDERLRRALGWGSVGSGLVLLAFADRVCRLLQLRDRSAHVRAAGLRDVIIGLGIVTRRDRRPWLWARSLSDAFDSAWLWKTVRERPRGAGGRAAVAAGGLGLTLIDFAAILTPKG